MTAQPLTGNIVDIRRRRIFAGELHWSEGHLTEIRETGPASPDLSYLMPGFVDSHVHIESSMLIPSEFARLAVVHGTVGTISDPHEIANVCGMEGVRYMIRNSRTVPFKCHFGAPSCVPATPFETAGATLTTAEVDELLGEDDIYYLSEMMNFPGVLHQDPEVMAKIASAKRHGKPVDGHAPGLRGEQAEIYIRAGIDTDHECFTEEEALDKLQRGMNILIREGSAARNFEALIPLLHDHEDRMMFCSDDKHPDSLVEGHIDRLCARAVAAGVDVFKVLKAACLNPVSHYRMRIGTMQPGDPADFIEVKDLVDFQVLGTWIDGIQVAKNGRTLIGSTKAPLINRFHAEQIQETDLRMPDTGAATLPVIEALDGQLITRRLDMQPLAREGQWISDPARDMLKIAVINRYQKAPVALGFIRNIGLRQGALASSVAHDSHNIVAVGADDASLCRAVNAIILHGGGISAVGADVEHVLALPVAGLMSNLDGYTIANKYTAIDRYAKSVLGSPLSAPFMTLSFMALLVIPHLKMSDKGMFDGDRFCLLD